GHPLPHLQHLTLSMAVMLRSREGGRVRLSELELPDTLPRLVNVRRKIGPAAAFETTPAEAASTNGVLAEGVPAESDPAVSEVLLLEELVRGNLDLLHPQSIVENASLFRVTRGAALALDEESTDDLLDAVSSAADARRHNAV